MGADERQPQPGPPAVSPIGCGQAPTLPALAPGNVAKVMSAPVTAIVAYDLKFYEKQPKLLPFNPKMRELFAQSPELVETTARRNSSLQGAYLMLAARALGLDCGPISGFDNSKVDQEFFGAGTPCEGSEEEFLPEGASSRIPVQPGLRRSGSPARATAAAGFRGGLRDSLTSTTRHSSGNPAACLTR